MSKKNTKPVTFEGTVYNVPAKIAHSIEHLSETLDDLQELRRYKSTYDANLSRLALKLGFKTFDEVCIAAKLADQGPADYIFDQIIKKL